MINEEKWQRRSRRRSQYTIGYETLDGTEFGAGGKGECMADEGGVEGTSVNAVDVTFTFLLLKLSVFF
jgi:hypothetical protein